MLSKTSTTLSCPKPEEPKLKPHQDPKNLAKLEKTITAFPTFPSSTRLDRQKLLVLDLDYCIADTKRLLDPNSPASLAARPGLHEMLKAVYPPYYESASGRRHRGDGSNVKLVELNMLGNPDYNIHL